MDITEGVRKFNIWCLGKYSPKTTTTYGVLTKRFAEYVGERAIGEIDVDDFVRFYGHLTKQNLKATTVMYHMIALRQMWKFFFLQHWTVIDWQLIPVPKAVSKSYIPATTGDAQQMIDSIVVKDFTSLRDKTILSFLYSSGVRVSELCDLMIGDLDLNQRVSHIISKKNNKRRMVFWDVATHDLLILYLSRRLKILEKNGVADHGYVFINTGRTANNAYKNLTTRSVQRIVKRVRENTGITKTITPHSFRHGLGMSTVQSGIHPRYVQVILGHKNINSSQTYMDYNDQDVVDAYRKVAKKRSDEDFSTERVDSFDIEG